MTASQHQAKILWNRNIGSAYYHMGLSCAGFPPATPGQFIMVAVSGQHPPLLRRPFSIYHAGYNGTEATVELLYKVVGTGTEILSQKAPEAMLNILGPLGNGFTLAPSGRRIYFAGGGIGVPPLLFLATALHQKGYDMAGCQLFLGGRSKSDLLCQDEFRRLGINIHLTTDDGSAGDQCLITTPLAQAIADAPPDILYACGPLPMLHCILGIQKQYPFRCQVSIETLMACGIGACLGCAVPKSDGSGQYWHACQNGPVFDADQIDI